MSLSPGSKLGIYEVVAPLGAGGMGEVYRARDTKLGRDVAIKALPAAFAQDPERLARFEREAKLLASLSHPNIAAIFGLEDIAGHRYLILEFVEGETLAQRLDHGTLAIDEALKLSRQIAAALETAHENGVAHRDLKPGNVMITPAGDAKVLDFGLAKGGMGSGSGSDVNLSHSPTMTQHTGAGVILGTAAYMSPEQARGRTVDKRTDIWSFGCVLYECLTGRQAFLGDTTSDLIARILEREPDWDALPARTPPRIRELLRRCLTKDSKQRLRDIGDARIEIDNVISVRASSPEAIAAAAERSRNRVRTIVGAVTLVLLTAAATYFATARMHRAPAEHATRFQIPEPPGTFIMFDGAHSAISPDGRTLAFCASDSTGRPQLWLRDLESLQARQVAGTDIAQIPFWSPDSRSVAFFPQLNRLMKVSVSGGAPELIASCKSARGGSWGRDGVILYAPLSEGPIYRVSANGGDGVAVTKLDSTESAHRSPLFLPDGKHFLYVALPPRDGRFRIFFASLDGKEKHLVLDTASGQPVYSDPGYLLYDREGVIVAQRFDAKKGRVMGEPVSIGDRPVGSDFSGAAGFSVSDNGTIAYLTNGDFATKLVWMKADGQVIADVPSIAGPYVNVNLSPDERQAVLESAVRKGMTDLWLADLERGVVTRMTYEAGENTSARWSPDGSRIAYTSAPPQGYQKIVVAGVGGGTTKTFLEGDNFFKTVECWTHDGHALVIASQNPDTKWDLWILPVDSDEKPRPFLVTPFQENSAQLSPDGKWLLYTSDESGKFDLYAQAFPDGGSKYKITTSGSLGGGFSADGKQVYFTQLNSPGIGYAADILPGPQFRLGPARPRFKLSTDAFSTDVSRDGRIIALMPARPLPPATITVVENWRVLLSGK